MKPAVATSGQGFRTQNSIEYF